MKSSTWGGRVSRDDGGDILFTSADGISKLNHELSAYSPSSGQLTVWVRVPMVSASTDTVIYLYCGNAFASPQQNRTGVWDSHYLGVWHLDGNPVLYGNDATALGANASVYGATATAGVAGGAGYFNGKTDSVRTPVFGTTLRAATFSMWVNLKSHDDWAGLLYSRDSAALGAHFLANTNNLAYTWNSDSKTYLWNSGLQLPLNTWAYAVVTVSATRAVAMACISGVCSSNVNITPHYAATLRSEFRMGQDAYLTRYFQGSLDEVRLSDIDRTAGWSATEYANQSSPGTFYSLGAPELNSSAPSSVRVTVSSSPSGLGVTVDGTACVTPCYFPWVPGSSHSVTAQDQNGATGTRYRFLGWSDSGAWAHTIVAPASGTASAPLTVTANYDTQHFLMTSVSPASAGSIAPASGWFSAGTTVTLTATAASGYQFSAYQGSVLNSANPASFTISEPAAVVATFTPVSSPPASNGGSPQALVLRPGVTGNIQDPYFGQDRSWRIEFQMYDWTPPPAGQYGAYVFLLGGEGVYATIWPDGQLALTDFADRTASGGAPCFLPLANRTNVLVRFQRNYPQKRLVCEIWNKDGTGYSRSSDSIVSTTSNTNIGALGSAYTSVTLAFLRVFTTVLEDNGPPPSKSDSADWTDLSFNGTLEDSSGNGHRAALSSPVFVAMPPPQPEAVIRAGPAGWVDWVTVRAGFPAKLDGSGSKAGTGTLTYKWQQTAGPATLQWSSQTEPAPLVEGLIFGAYSVRLTVTDSSGASATANLDFGAVATDSNGVVIYPDPALDLILGPSLAFGTNPWDWFDYRHAAISQYWTRNYAINGGTWNLETDLDSVGGIARKGRAYVNAGASKIYGIGTNFMAVFCGGVPGPVVSAGAGEGGGYPYFVAKLTTGVANEAPRLYPRAIKSCQSDTEMTMSDGWTWERPQADPPGIEWGTWNSCPTCGDWFGLQTRSNINFYGNDLANYALYFRSGMPAARDSARWLADRWYRSPWNLFGQTPRDFGLTGAYLRAAVDGGHPTYDMWPTLRAFNDFCFSPAGYIYNGPIVDVRETAYCLAYSALQALFDPDPNSRQTAKDRVENAYNWQFGTRQTAAGAYVNNAIEGDFSRSFRVTKGSAVVKLNTGSAIPSDYCGVAYTATGTISLAQDRVSVTGAGTNFLNSAGKIIVLRGTLNGQPWSMTSQIAASPVPTATTLTLVHPWRGDQNSVVSNQWRIFDGTIRSTGFYTMFFGQTDAAGAYPKPQVLDEDNWYWCTVNDSQTLTLDKPYTGDTSGGNIYRRPTWQNLTGRGTQPFIMGIVGWAEYLAGKSLEGHNDTIAAGYRAAMTKTVDWIWTYGHSPATKGLYYGVGFSNCQNLSILPAHECAESAASSITERSYNVESNGAFARKYLLTRTASDLDRGDQYYNDQFARTGYHSPIPGDGAYADLIDPCCSFQNEKAYGQTFGIGQGHQWPAARLGGLQPATMVDVPVNIAVGSVPGAAAAKVLVTAPSLATSSFTCSTSPCRVKLDSRQGAHWVQVTYVSSTGATVQTTTPVLMKAP